jgi:hypothetical protein
VSYGDGNADINIRVFIGTRQLNVRGTEYKVLAVGNDTLEIEAENTNPNQRRTTPNIEIISLN